MVFIFLYDIINLPVFGIIFNIFLYVFIFIFVTTILNPRTMDTIQHLLYTNCVLP